MTTRQRGSHPRTSAPPQSNPASVTPAKADPARNSDMARDQRIAICAYLRAAERGFEPGHELEDWLAAERDLEACGDIAPMRSTPERSTSERSNRADPL